MAGKKSFTKQKDASTWLAYAIITWATLLGLHYTFVEKENRDYLSSAAELTQNKENLIAMRRLYATAVAEKMQQVPQIGTSAAVSAVHENLMKQFSNKDDTAFSLRAGNVIQKELLTLSLHTSRGEFYQLLLVYPYVNETQTVWEKTKPEVVEKHIEAYRDFANQMVIKGLESRLKF